MYLVIFFHFSLNSLTKSLAPWIQLQIQMIMMLSPITKYNQNFGLSFLSKAGKTNFGVQYISNKIGLVLSHDIFHPYPHLQEWKDDSEKGSDITSSLV